MARKTVTMAWVSYESPEVPQHSEKCTPVDAHVVQQLIGVYTVYVAWLLS